MSSIVLSFISALIGGLAVAFFNNKEQRMREELKILREKAEIIIGEVNVLRRLITRRASRINNCMKLAIPVEHGDMDDMDDRMEDIDANRKIETMVLIYFPGSRRDAIKFKSTCYEITGIYFGTTFEYNDAVKKHKEISEDLRERIMMLSAREDYMDSSIRLINSIVASVDEARQLYTSHSPWGYLRMRRPSIVP